MINLHDINFLVGTISAILLVFSEMLSIRRLTTKIRLSQDRLRKASIISLIVFNFTLMIIIVS